MAKMLILAGGMGTRLQPAVSDVPKPLAPVAGKPFLHFMISHWREQGVSEMIFLLRHQANLIETFLATERSGITIRTVIEPKALGTGGALAFAVHELGITGDFLAANADTWLGSGVREVLALPAPAIATVDVANCERYGSVTVENGKVVAFKEKGESTGAGTINAGLYHLNAALFSDWDGEAFSLEQKIFPPLARSGQLRAAALHTDFIDIGIPEDYFRFCRWSESGQTCPL
jgi:D-glycero-alpha-D-manno-heptose 1-phosphate guanylyltransferase